MMDWQTIFSEYRLLTRWPGRHGFIAWVHPVGFHPVGFPVFGHPTYPAYNAKFVWGRR